MAELVRPKIKKKLSHREIEEKLSKLDIVSDEIGNYSQNVIEEATNGFLSAEAELNPLIQSVDGNNQLTDPTEASCLKCDGQEAKVKDAIDETKLSECLENRQGVKEEVFCSAPIEEFTQRIAECTLPRTYDSKGLKNFAFTGHVKEVQKCESWIAEESESVLSAQQTSTPNPLFQLIADYVKMMNEFVSLMHKLCLEEKEVKVLLNQLWVTEHKFGKKSGVCKDGFEVFLDYEYHTATFDQSNNISPKLQFLQRDNRHILCEQIPLVVSKVSLARLNIDNFLSSVISQCPTCSNSDDQSPFTKQDLSPNRNSDLKKLRAVVNVLFVSLRAYCSQHCKPPSSAQSSQENQGNFDPSSVADLHDFITDRMIDWIFLFVGLILQESTMFDHLALSIHLLRLPSGILRRSSGRLISMIQLPGRNPSEYMPLMEKEHGSPIVALLSHPMVQVQMALFQLYFSSIKDRFRLLQLYSIEQHSIEELRSVLSWNPISGPSEEEKALAAWTLVDSEGESDVSESQLAVNGGDAGGGVEEDPAYDHADLIMVSENTDQLSNFFHGELHPMQLEAFVAQLNLAQVFYAITQQTMSIWSAPIELGPVTQLEACCSGLLSLFAFIDQLIECLEQRSSRPFNQAGSRAAASWRKVFKRNGSLLQAIKECLNYRVQTMVSYYHQALHQSLAISEERMTQFNNMLGQYDYLCERITTLMLRHGAGVPHDVHAEVLRVALKNFPIMFPFNVTRTETKLKIVVEVLRTVYSGELADLRVTNIPSILTILQPNNSHLDRLSQIIIPVIQSLARVAGQECRFIAQPPHGNFDLPLVEEQLVKNVLLFIFLIYMNCNNREKYPVVTNAWFQKQNPVSTSQDRVFFFDCTVFDAAQEQIIFLSEQHPNVVIPLILQVILAIFQPQHSTLDSIFLKDLYSSSCGFTEPHLVGLCQLLQWTRLSSSTVCTKDLEVLVAFMACHQEPVESLTHLLSHMTRSICKKSANSDKNENCLPIETCGCQKHSNSLVHLVAKAILGRVKVCKLLKEAESRLFQDNYLRILSRLLQIHLDQPKVLSETHFLPILDSAYSLAEYIQNAGQSVGDLALTMIGRQPRLAIILPTDPRQKGKIKSPFADSSRDPDELFNFVADQIHYLNFFSPDHSDSQEVMVRKLKLVLDENSFNNLENLVNNSKNVALLSLLLQMELDPLLQRGSTLTSLLQTSEGELWLKLISRLLSMKQHHLTFDFILRVLNFAALDASSEPTFWCGPRESSGALFSNLLLTIFSAPELKKRFLYRFVQALFQWDANRSLQVVYHFLYATAACHQLTKFTSTSNCVKFLDKLCEVEFVLLQKAGPNVDDSLALKTIAYLELLNLQEYLCSESLSASIMYQSSMGGFKSRSNMISNLLTFHGNAGSILKTTFDDLNVKLGHELDSKRTKRSHSAFGLLRRSHIEESSSRNGNRTLFQPFWLVNRLLSICPQSEMTRQVKLFSILQRESVRILTSANRITMSKSSMTTSTSTSTGSISPSESVLVDVMLENHVVKEEELNSTRSQLELICLGICQSTPLVQSLMSFLACNVKHEACQFIAHHCLKQMFEHMQTEEVDESEKIIPPGLFLLKTLYASPSVRKGRSGNNSGRVPLLNLFVDHMRFAYSHWATNNSRVSSWFEEISHHVSELSSQLDSLPHSVSATLFYLKSLSFKAPEALDEVLDLVKVDVLRERIVLNLCAPDQIQLMGPFDPDCGDDRVELVSKCKTFAESGLKKEREFIRLSPEDVLLSDLFRCPVFAPTKEQVLDQIRVCLNKLGSCADAYLKWEKLLAKKDAELLEEILPSLYQLYEDTHHATVPCQSKIPLLRYVTAPCQGGALISHTYQTARLNRRNHESIGTNRHSYSTGKRNLLMHVWAILGLNRACLEINPQANPLYVLTEAGMTLGAVVKSLDQDKEHMQIRTLVFDTLCRSLQGKFFEFNPVRKIIGRYIQNLVEDMKDTLSNKHELVLNMLVALPSLHELLIPLFNVPSPPPYGNQEEAKLGSANRLAPLQVVLKRLVDVCTHCSQRAANEILERISLEPWMQNGRFFNGTHATVPQWCDLITMAITLIEHLSKEARNSINDMDAGPSYDLEIDQKLKCIQFSQKVLLSILQKIVALPHPDIFLHYLATVCQTSDIGAKMMWDLASEIMSQRPVYDSGEYEMLEKCANQCIDFLKILQNSKRRFANFSSDMMMSFVNFEKLLLEELTQRLVPVLSTIPAESHEYTQQLRKIQSKLSNLLNGLLGHSLAVCVHWEYTTSSDSIIRNSNNNDQICASLQILNWISHFFQNTLVNSPHIRNDVMDDFMCWLVRTHVLLDIAKTGSVQSASSLPSESPLWVLLHLLARAEKEQQNETNSFVILDPVFPHWYPSYNFLTFCINFLKMVSDRLSNCDRLRLIRFFVHLLRKVDIQTASKHGINMTRQQEFTWPTVLLTLLNNLTCGLLSCVVNGQQSADTSHSHNNLDMFLFDCSKNQRCHDAQTLEEAKLLIEEVSMKVNFEEVSSSELFKVFNDLLGIVFPGEYQVINICSLMILAPVNTVPGKLFGLLAISAGISSSSDRKENTSLYPDVRRDDNTKKKCHYVSFIVQALMAAMSAMKKDYALRMKCEQVTPPKQDTKNGKAFSTSQNGWNPIHTIYNQYAWLYDNVLRRYGTDNAIKAEDVRAQDRLNFFKQLCFLRILALLSDMESATCPQSHLDSFDFLESSLMVSEFCRLLELDSYEGQLKKLQRCGQSQVSGLPSSRAMNGNFDQLDPNLQDINSVLCIIALRFWIQGAVEDSLLQNARISPENAPSARDERLLLPLFYRLIEYHHSLLYEKAKSEGFLSVTGQNSATVSTDIILQQLQDIVWSRFIGINKVSAPLDHDAERRNPMQQFAQCLIKLDHEVKNEIDSQPFTIAIWLVPSIKRLNSTLLLSLIVEWRKFSLAICSNYTPSAILSDILFWLRETQLSSKDVLLDYAHSANLAGILLLFHSGMNLIFYQNGAQARAANLTNLDKLVSALEDNFLVPWLKSLSSTSFILGRAWESACSLSNADLNNEKVSSQQDSYPRVLFSAMYSTISHLATKTIPGTLQSSAMLAELKKNTQTFEEFIKNLRKMAACLKVCQSNPNVSDPILWLEEFRSMETPSSEEPTAVSAADSLFQLITEELCSFAYDSTVPREILVHKLALIIFQHACGLHWYKLPMRVLSSIKAT